MEDSRGYHTGRQSSGKHTGDPTDEATTARRKGPQSDRPGARGTHTVACLSPIGGVRADHQTFRFARPDATLSSVIYKTWGGDCPATIRPAVPAGPDSQG